MISRRSLAFSIIRKTSAWREGLGFGASLPEAVRWARSLPNSPVTVTNQSKVDPADQIRT